MDSVEIIKGKQFSGDEVSCEASDTDSSSLDMHSSISPEKSSNEENSLSKEELLCREMMDSYSDVFRDFIENLDSDREKAISMFNFYSDLAANSADAEIAEKANAIAVNYLKIAVESSSSKKDVVKTLISSVFRKSLEGSKKEGDKNFNINGDINFGTGIPRRELLSRVKESKDIIEAEFDDIESNLES